jgi:hypothetical protein
MDFEVASLDGMRRQAKLAAVISLLVLLTAFYVCQFVLEMPSEYVGHIWAAVAAWDFVAVTYLHSLLGSSLFQLGKFSANEAGIQMAYTYVEQPLINRTAIRRQLHWNQIQLVACELDESDNPDCMRVELIEALPGEVSRFRVPIQDGIFTKAMVDDVIAFKAASQSMHTNGAVDAAGQIEPDLIPPRSRALPRLVNVGLLLALSCLALVWPTDSVAQMRFDLLGFTPGMTIKQADALPTKFTCAPIQELINKMMDTEARAREEVAVGMELEAKNPGSTSAAMLDQYRAIQARKIGFMADIGMMLKKLGARRVCVTQNVELFGLPVSQFTLMFDDEVVLSVTAAVPMKHLRDLSLAIGDMTGEESLRDRPDARANLIQYQLGNGISDGEANAMVLKMENGQALVSVMAISAVRNGLNPAARPLKLTD